MKKTAINSIYPYLKGSYPIGIGNTAICFLMKDGNVLKVFLNTYDKYILFNSFNNVIEHFEKINSIKNDTYIAPEELLIKDGYCVGYIYPYQKAKTLKKMKLNTKIDSLINSYDKLLEDTIDISNKKLSIFDISDRNILFNTNFKIIDLDHFEFFKNKSEEEILKNNMIKINKTIIYSLFDKNRMFNTMDFYNIHLKEMYKENVINNYKNMKLFLSELKKYNINTKLDCMLKEKNLVYSEPKEYHGM